MSRWRDRDSCEGDGILQRVVYANDPGLREGLSLRYGWSILWSAIGRVDPAPARPTMGHHRNNYRYPCGETLLVASKLTGWIGNSLVPRPRSGPVRRQLGRW